MLIFSDIHYPIGKLKTVENAVKKEKPDNLVLLGDNIELSRFTDHKKAYSEFFAQLDSIFPIKKSIIMLGDNDYQYASDNSVADIVLAYDPINSKAGELIFFSKNSMHFFHGNLEKSKIIERIGYEFVIASNHINYTIAPKLMAFVARNWFRVKKEDYMLLGHLHYLGLHNRNIFCGTLNREFTPFPNSIGYVTLEHKNFAPIPESIKLFRLK